MKEKKKVSMKFFGKKKSKDEPKKSYKNKFWYLTSIIVLKLILIIFVIFGLYEYESPFSNSIALLAVSENGDGEIVAGSIIDLSLTIKPGSGEVFVNLDSIEEIDTQISIINSNKIACSLFELNCEDFDFFYEFDSNSLILKGPSASSAIAILTAKTMNNVKIITDEVAITGSLNSGGLIGVVGGVDKKIQTASNHKFKKVLVPAFSSFNESINYTNIEVIKSLDIIEAYNEFNGDTYELKTAVIESSEYENLMKQLANDMCSRSSGLGLEIKEEDIIENSTFYRFEEAAKKSINSSKVADEVGNYYSMASYCYNANLNYRNIIEGQKNLSLNIRDEQIESLKNKIESRLEELTSSKYKDNVLTVNDFYVYLILVDRLFESKELIDNALELEVELKEFIVETINESSDNLSNESTFESKSLINDSTRIELEKVVKRQKETLYSYAIERFNTVDYWEKFSDHSGGEVEFNDLEIYYVCSKINREISIKSELLQSYNLNIFDELISEQLKLDNPGKNQYLCVYKGLELNGRINTVLNSVGVNSEDETEFLNKLVELTESRINVNANGEFPFIPTIYSEYSKDLIAGGDVNSGILYSNYALSYADLNVYLDKSEPIETLIDTTLDKLFENILFVFSIMIIIAFLQ